MGNVLGFQFQLDEGGQSGALRFFRCSGVGRELLLGLHDLPAVDGRPGPNVLLMSATSWAGTSSRYHVHVPVGAVLRPSEKEVKAILETTFRKEFLYGPDGQPLRLSGAGVQDRPGCSGRCSGSSPSRSGHSPGRPASWPRNWPTSPMTPTAAGPHPHRQLRRGKGRRRVPERHAGVGGRVTALISDDADFDDAWTAPALAARPGGAGSAAATSRRSPRPAARSWSPRCSPSSAATTSCCPAGRPPSAPSTSSPARTPGPTTSPSPSRRSTTGRSATSATAGSPSRCAPAGSLDAAGLAFRQRPGRSGSAS